MSKIFCIGLNKTGTTSLHTALKILGFNSVHYKDKLGNSIKKTIRDNYLNGIDILTNLREYDAFLDWDSTHTVEIFKQFDKQYPNSKFIINIREMDTWLDSREKHVKRNQILRKNNPNIKWTKVDREKWSELYKKHYNSALKYFKKREKDYIIIDVTKKEGWEKICNFLNRPIPKIPFPKKNVSK